ncbi:flagellar basal body-associated FliL family protein [Paracoccus sp. (in: a-proteobacteria)]|uniref:flagellar basal body-associated FliL family protein n=1 Tax=Paracoccus sp. TaxID=267 RepID=UPI0026E096E4|nr:flagellar basal body-associated FliL family protein [Paracoccus sp. (in: a-proteobacteria)]MDO5648391.1 flagellar basal body protein FliL [Paracoccus sp. (in: a-proteobacteria)]
MSQAAVATEDKAPKKKGMLVALLGALVLGGGGFASTYMGMWSPGALMTPAPAAASLPDVAFIDIPVIELAVPGPRARTLILAASIETDATHRAAIDHLMPRLLDAFTTFLSDVDPAAYERRGVLEIIRAELLNRARLVLGNDAAHNLLITEFRFK